MFYVLGWGRLAAKPPTYPIPYKEDVIICYSERSEESTVLPDNNTKKRNPFLRKKAVISGD